MAKRIVSFRNFANAHEYLTSYHAHNTELLHYTDQLIFRTKKKYSPYEKTNPLFGHNEFLKTKKSGVKFRTYIFLGS